MTTTRRGGLFLAFLLAALAAVLLSSCVDDELAEPPFVPDVGGELFTRYVSLGNSITAGFQSGGLHGQLQRHAYPVLLAQKAGATFGVPVMSIPGCPPPLVAPLSAERIAPGTCYGRSVDHPPLVQNLAVPGHRMVDAFSHEGPGASTLATMILGGRTQVSAMTAAEPTLVSLWLGNNDVLGAALSGDTTRLTPGSQFAPALEIVTRAIAALDPQDAILIGIADPIAIAPALQPGAYFWAVAASGEAPVPLAVADNCAPGTAGGARWVSFLVANDHISGEADSVRVDCGAEAAFVLNEAEAAAVHARVTAFNSLIRGIAEEKEWIYVDPATSFIGPALSDPDQVRKCQGLTTAETAAEVEAAVAATCPVPEAPNFYGSFFSFDGIHPSSAAHAVIADTLARRLNAKHGLSLPTGG